MFNVIKINNEQFHNCSRTLKDAWKYSRTTRCFSRIMDKTSFDSKLKVSPWRLRTSGNLMSVTFCACVLYFCLLFLISFCGQWNFSPSPQSRRHGAAFGGLAPQIETWNTINQLSFCQFLECQAPAQTQNPLLKTFWRQFCLACLHLH